jgi:[ribosomal protein S18]-alanine N-acetyltransferase
MVRAGSAADLAAISAIQAECPEAAHWEPAEYLNYQLLVAVLDGRVTGFLVGRTTAEGEHEVLNLAVAPAFRRRGAGRELLREFALRQHGQIFLEVRQSNQVAQDFYKSMGFRQVAVRPGYYDRAPDDGVVMNFHSC